MKGQTPEVSPQLGRKAKVAPLQGTVALHLEQGIYSGKQGLRLNLREPRT